MSKIEVKSLIVETATTFFSKFGFGKTTMDEIAKHIHKAKGVLYYYFRSKEELFNEVLKQELLFVKIELNKITNSNNDSLIILKEYILTRLLLLNKALNYHETLKADFFDKYHFVTDVRDDFIDFEGKQLSLILSKGKIDGYLNISDINKSVNIILMIFNGIELPLFLQNKYEEYKESFNELSTIIVEGLRNQKK